MGDPKIFIAIGERTLNEIEKVREEYPEWFEGCQKGDLHSELIAYCTFIKYSALKAKWSKSARQLAKNTLELLDHLERMPVQISNNTENDTTNKNSKAIIKVTDINSQLIEQLVYRLGQIQSATIKKHKDAIKSILERSGSIENDWERDIEREVRKLLGGEESREYGQLNSEPLNDIIKGIFEKQTQLERQVLQNGLKQARAFLLALQACGALDQIELPEQPQNQEQQTPVKTGITRAKLEKARATKDFDKNPVRIKGAHPASTEYTSEANASLRRAGAYLKGIKANTNCKTRY